ncbi:hypothetical protein NG799_16070, partial [Laspinema sp. D1]|nr:hypothetical protein [Laspinema sp. D2a]
MLNHWGRGDGEDGEDGGDVRSNDFSRYLVTWRTPSNAPMSGSSSPFTGASAPHRDCPDFSNETTEVVT